MDYMSLLEDLPHVEDVSLALTGFNPAYSKKLALHVPKHAGTLTKLKGFIINIDADSPVTDADVCELAKIPMLSQLAISPLEKVDVTDEALACLNKLQGLRTLAVNNTRITDEGLAHSAV